MYVHRKLGRETDGLDMSLMRLNAMRREQNCVLVSSTFMHAAHMELRLFTLNCVSILLPKQISSVVSEMKKRLLSCDLYFYEFLHKLHNR